MRSLQFRGVQLDLARQKESIGYIKGFIDFISRFNYNLLVLYLEGRIKTKTFPYLNDAESYQPEEMIKIVKYAKGKGIEVMPVVSNLSHSEMFLQAKQLQHLAELRGGRAGRFTLPRQSPFLNMCCPSLNETYGFFERYYSEIAEIFPFEYFHVGNDEAWDIGFCDLCKLRAEGEEGQDGIFANHLLRTHEFVTKKLGKTMVIWDDMFEHYPSVLEKIPKDIILCCWQYDDHIELPKGHFAGHARFDAFALYEKLGFEYFFAPIAKTLRNIDGFTTYALKYTPLGGIITNWEKQESFLIEHYPVIGTAGELWGGNYKTIEVAHRESAKRIFENNNELVDTLEIIGMLKPLPLSINTHAFYLNPVTFAINERLQLNKIINKQLTQNNSNKGDESRNIIEDLSVRIREENLRIKLLQLISEVFGRVNKLYYGEPKELLHGIEEVISEIKFLKGIRERQWKRYREEFLSIKMEKRWECLERNSYDLWRVATGENRQETGMLIIHYFLPDMFSAPVIRLQINYEGAEEWEDVACGIYKPIILGDARDNNPYFTMAYTIDFARPVAKCRIESWGCGRQGITFIEVVNKTGHFIPNKQMSLSGEVENPENLMVDDLSWCSLGYKDTNAVFQNPCLAKVKHTLSLGLKSI